MKREELGETILTLFYGIIALTAITIFIIPALICRLVQDRK